MLPYNDNIDKIKQYIRSEKYDCVIQLCNPLYCSTKDTIYLNYILDAYKKTKNNINAISNFKMLLTHAYPIPVHVCILHNEIGMYHSYSNEYAQAIEHFNKILTINNSVPDVYYNIGMCYSFLKEYDKAIVSLNFALRLSPSDNIYSKLGQAQLYAKDYSGSIQSYESITHKTDICLYNSSFPYLAKKSFLMGYTLYEKRLVSNNICNQTGLLSRVEIQLPYWDGSEPCNHLMIAYEQGIGDNIQYFRFIIELSQKYPDLKITYFCKEAVSYLLNNNLYSNISILNDTKQVDLSCYDKKIYIMSLPYILKIDILSANTINYIYEDKYNNDIWKNKLSVFNDKLKVGIVYKGLLNSTIDKNIELNCFKDICTDKNIQCICLHIMKDTKILYDFAEIDFKDDIIHYDIDKCIPFIDTISILRNLDVLVTIDTSIAHLAGVMGIKTFLLIGYTSDWRWFNNDEKIWYDSVEIIRMNDNSPLSNLLPRVKNLLIEEYNNHKK